jgi:DHA1 family multidrug resistance protein-like MFS transporter
MIAVFQTFPIIFTKIHHLTPAQTSLTFLSLGLGSTLGAVLNFYLTRRSHTPAVVERWRGFTPPERRLWGAMFGGPGLVLGVFWLGWTGQYASVPFGVPLASGVLVGASVSLVFMSFLVRFVSAGVLVLAFY